MQKFNFPTTMLFGAGALKDCAQQIKQKNLERPLLVTDPTLVKLGLADSVAKILTDQGLTVEIFSDTLPNPTDAEVEAGAQRYKEKNCDCLVALGGGSPIDTAKVIKVRIAHVEPLSLFDDTKGGDQHIKNTMPRLFAIPTTAGTGSEVGRSGVIILRETGLKTIIFHPDLLPDIAVLAPELTTDLPPKITAATGVDAFVHCLEAWFAPGIHPMADAIALYGMELIVKYLPTAISDGKNLEARGMMLIAASMGATAFQKGLGMIHSMAHPLSSEFGLHHGLANALLLPESIAFIERGNLSPEQHDKIDRVKGLFPGVYLSDHSLSHILAAWLESLQIEPGLGQFNIKQSDIPLLSNKAIHDPCHQTNMIPVQQDDLAAVYTKAL